MEAAANPGSSDGTEDPGASGQQAGGQVPVQFNGIQLAAAGDQRRRQCALTGANFHHVIILCGRNGAGDGLDNTVVLQEVLSKALAGCGTPLWMCHDRDR